MVGYMDGAPYDLWLSAQLTQHEQPFTVYMVWYSIVFFFKGHSKTIPRVTRERDIGNMNAIKNESASVWNDLLLLVFMWKSTMTHYFWWFIKLDSVSQFFQKQLLSIELSMDSFIDCFLIHVGEKIISFDIVSLFSLLSKSLAKKKHYSMYRKS